MLIIDIYYQHCHVRPSHFTPRYLQSRGRGLGRSASHCGRLVHVDQRQDLLLQGLAVLEVHHARQAREAFTIEKIKNETNLDGNNDNF